MTASDARTADPSWVDRSVAMAFAIGGTVHAVSFVLALRGIYVYGVNYPTWRHPLIALIEATLVAIGLRAPRWLPAGVALFALEQCLRNGLWRPFTLLLVVVLAVLLWRRR